MNKFNAGLITDASPLTSPDNSSLEEDNFVLNIDGSRNRRLGMDYELAYQNISTSIVEDNTLFATSSYKWSNAGGVPDKNIQVVQIGNQLKFFRMDEGALSAGLFWSQNFSSARDKTFSYTTVDGVLVVVNGDKDVYYIEFIAPNSLVVSARRLLIRDLFGVEDFYNGIDITRGTDVTNRPAGISNPHVYNLRNQSFGIPRYTPRPAAVEGTGVPRGGGTPPATPVIQDPIASFKTAAGVYPSNADSVIQALYPDTQDPGNRTVERFFANDLTANPIGTTRAAQGYFIIDALDRGSSRYNEYQKNMARYPELSIGLGGLPADSSPTGPTAVTEFAGRVWYAGFSGEVVQPDNQSPKLSSYVLFSKVVDNILDANLCYQEGDPTAKDNADIVATDGGFIRLNEAYDIKRLINLGSSLMVVAANGVWRIVGGSDVGFTANAYIVEKISDRGCTSPNSIVVLDSTFMFWSDDAIYHVAPDQSGALACNNISFGRIQKFYDDISVSNKRMASGAYDSYERKVRWVFNNNLIESAETRELVLDLQLQAYYVNTIKTPETSRAPRVLMTYIGLPYIVTTDEIDILVGTDIVQAGSDDVIIDTLLVGSVQQKEIGYIVITGVNPTLSYTFAKYSDLGFRDWRSFNGVGVDADAYLITSYLSGTDYQRDKGATYITVHLRRSETGFDDDMNPINPSSCLMQARWGWANSDNSGKWGREAQVYRYRRMYLPVDTDDPYDNGFSVISSRNKVRGTGKVLSLRFRTEPDCDLHLYGWSMIFSVSENV